MARIRDLSGTRAAFDAGAPATLRGRLAAEIRSRRERSIFEEIAIGVVSGLFAVAVRFALPLDPRQLPTLPVVVMLAVVTTFVGVWAGISTAVLGGLLR